VALLLVANNAVEAAHGRVVAGHAWRWAEAGTRGTRQIEWQQRGGFGGGRARKTNKS
jgi:hypothetical protein